MRSFRNAVHYRLETICELIPHVGIVGALKLLAETRSQTMEVRKDVHDAFNVRVDAANAKMAWGTPNVTSWYKNATGRVSQNWPFPLVDYWNATIAPNPNDFVLKAKVKTPA